MGYRLSKIYTRTGDQGSTALGNGQRVSKDDPRIEAIGTVDELNCLIGIVQAQRVPAAVDEILTLIQHQLFDLGGELAMPDYRAIDAGKVARLEQELDRLNQTLPPLQEFILPAGSPASAHCHHARSVCRRAERRLLSLARGDETLNPECLKYLNRLSDLLFVIARVLARENGGEEVYWRNESK